MTTPTDALLAACEQLAEGYARSLRAVQNLTSAGLEGRGITIAVLHAYDDQRRKPRRISSGSGRSWRSPKPYSRCTRVRSDRILRACDGCGSGNTERWRCGRIPLPCQCAAHALGAYQRAS